MVEKHVKSGLSDRFTIGDVQIDSVNNTLTVNANKCNVEPRLIRIIVKLAQCSGNIVKRSELLEEISQQGVVSDESLTQAISKLRQLLGDSTKTPRFIKTIPRNGYMLLVPAFPVKPMFQTQYANKASVGEYKPKIPPISTNQFFFALLFIIVIIVISVSLWPEQTTFIEKGETEFIEKED
ncbi:winged helix-turn-helix domain-containing protein [Planctobacterium marinum]|uniref:winged helix-turn-helix domain-containing protein n=1 Tax=Planctobacterium marinum TaxID=1631968 RepID=UPI001E4486C4|nr:winged helix-turn-helix domain-containing protein [Planctobacterium marinum]MCC2605728.1 winged helix-turn-helix domain-containing protein [Planctobacterium marinum]